VYHVLILLFYVYNKNNWWQLIQVYKLINKNKNKDQEVNPYHNQNLYQNRRENIKIVKKEKINKNKIQIIN
jgi:hypothetical protein